MLSMELMAAMKNTQTKWEKNSRKQKNLRQEIKMNKKWSGNCINAGKFE